MVKSQPFYPSFSSIPLSSTAKSALTSRKGYQTLPYWIIPNPTHDLIDLAASHIEKLEVRDRAAFIAGHPRIGEVSNLSAMSAAEQASKRASPQVLHQLELLNAAYEQAYPSLRYITFVNGRTRAEIVPEMEKLLGLMRGIEDSTPKSIVVHQIGSQEWEAELDRAVHDIILIAKARLVALGLT